MGAAYQALISMIKVCVRVTRMLCVDMEEKIAKDWGRVTEDTPSDIKSGERLFFFAILMFFLLRLRLFFVSVFCECR